MKTTGPDDIIPFIDFIYYVYLSLLLTDHSFFDNSKTSLNRFKYLTRLFAYNYTQLIDLLMKHMRYVMNIINVWKVESK